jgi:hypothetical protein
LVRRTDRGTDSLTARQDKLSWNKGRADAMRGAPSKCPKGLVPQGSFQQENGVNLSSRDGGQVLDGTNQAASRHRAMP